MSDGALKDIGAQIGGSMVNLKSLLLDFRGCCQVTDRGVLALSQEISTKMPQLTLLNLNYEGCELVSKDGIVKMARQIAKGLKNLDHLTLSLFWTIQVREETRNKILSILRHVPNLHIV